MLRSVWAHVRVAARWQRKGPGTHLVLSSDPIADNQYVSYHSLFAANQLLTGPFRILCGAGARVGGILKGWILPKATTS